MIYEYKKNESFDYMAYRLNKKEVIDKNPRILYLFKDDLGGVDVWGSNLNESKKSNIVNEINSNMWYFFRNILRMPQNGNINSPVDTLYNLNEATLELLWILEMGHSAWVTAPRNSCVVYTIASWVVWNAICSRIPGRIIERVRVIVPNADIHEMFETIMDRILTKSIPNYIYDYTDKWMVRDLYDSIKYIECTSKIDAVEIYEKSTSRTLNIFIGAEYIPYIGTAYNKKGRSIFYSTVSEYYDAKKNGVFDILGESIPFVDKLYKYENEYSRKNDGPFKLFHIKKQLCQLIRPDELRDLYDEMCSQVGWDTDIIRREILLERK